MTGSGLWLYIDRREQGDFVMANKTVTSPKGFFAAGVSCGIKQSGNRDMGLLVCPTGARAAAVFTTNKITSAAVAVSRRHVKSAKIFAVIVNSGNANACTGGQGVRDALKMCDETAKRILDFRFPIFDSKSKTQNPKSKISNRQLAIGNVLVASTGIIGHQLPMKRVLKGISDAAKSLSDSEKAGLDFAHSIMTTDTRCKQALAEVTISGKQVTVAGTVKGAGMIGPNMATTLSFITTDAVINRGLLSEAFKEAIGNSLNKLTVDGHQSTNDTAVILASGLAGNYPIVSRCPRYKKFTQALAGVCDCLVRQMALDAEGATRMFKVVVNGAATVAEASKAARAVADYPLVKCAIHGGDPNWGRIICAVGSSGVRLNQQKLSCKIGNITVFEGGRPKKFDAKKASSIILMPEHTITVDLGAGGCGSFCYGCDLSAGYVKINADYST